MRTFLVTTKKYRRLEGMYLDSLECQIYVLKQYLSKKRITRELAELMIAMLDTHLKSYRLLPHKRELVNHPGLAEALQFPDAMTWAVEYRERCGFKGLTRKQI